MQPDPDSSLSKPERPHIVRNHQNAGVGLADSEWFLDKETGPVDFPDFCLVSSPEIQSTSIDKRGTSDVTFGTLEG